MTAIAGMNTIMATMRNVEMEILYWKWKTTSINVTDIEQKDTRISYKYLWIEIKSSYIWSITQNIVFPSVNTDLILYYSYIKTFSVEVDFETSCFWSLAFSLLFGKSDSWKQADNNQDLKLTVVQKCIYAYKYMYMYLCL